MVMKMEALRVAPVLDPSQWVQGANAMDGANKRLDTGLRDVQVELGVVGAKVTQTRSQFDTLAKSFQEGYREETQLSRGLRVLSFEMETNGLSASRATAIYSGMVRELGLTANAADLARQSHGRLAGVVGAVNAELTQEIALANRAALALKNLDAVNDNMSGRMGGMDPGARFRRQGLMYQGFDIGTSLAGGINPGMVAVQQGPQILQLYAGQGGATALLKDAGHYAGLLAVRLGPVAVAAAAGALVIRDMEKGIEAATGKSVTFGDVFSASMDVIGEDIHSLLKPAIDQITPWMESAMKGAVDWGVWGADQIVNSFEAAYTDIKFVWEQFPNMMEAVVFGGVNAVVGGVERMLNGVVDRLNTWIDALNKRLSGLMGGGDRFERFDPFKVGKPLPDTAADDVSKAWEQRNRDIERIMGQSRIGGYIGSVRDRVQDRIGGLTLPDGGAGGAIPTPQFRGIDDQPGATDFMRDATRQHEIRMRGLQDEARLLGLTGSAAASLRAEQELLADAYKRNIDLAPDQIEAIRRQAAAYGEQADALARVKLGQDLAFERQQLFRSPGERDIASKLRSTGESLDGPTAQYMRDTQRFEELRDGVKGFATDFKDALLDNGGDIGDAFAKSIANAAATPLDVMDDDAFDRLCATLEGA